MTPKKISKAFEIATCFKGTATKQHILKNMQDDDAVLSTLTAKQLAAVINVANRSYHDGKASCKAEIADDCIWIGGQMQKLIPLDILNKIKIIDTVEYVPVTKSWFNPSGIQRWDIHHYFLDATERF